MLHEINFIDADTNPAKNCPSLSSPLSMTCCDNSFAGSNVAVHWVGSNVLSSHLLFQTVLDDATTAWGIKVERVEM